MKITVVFVYFSSYFKDKLWTWNFSSSVLNFSRTFESARVCIVVVCRQRVALSKSKVRTNRVHKLKRWYVGYYQNFFRVKNSALEIAVGTVCLRGSLHRWPFTTDFDRISTSRDIPRRARCIHVLRPKRTGTWCNTALAVCCDACTPGSRFVFDVVFTGVRAFTRMIFHDYRDRIGNRVLYNNALRRRVAFVR
jgi:hypothetical protein